MEFAHYKCFIIIIINIIIIIICLVFQGWWILFFSQTYSSLHSSIGVQEKNNDSFMIF